jgi:hypothetical protein
MFTIDFDFDQYDLTEDIKLAALEAVLADAREKVHFLLCPEHHESADVTLDGDTLNIAGCCEAFTAQAANEIMKERVVQ